MGIDDVSLARCCLTCPCSREVAERWPFAERRSCLALALAGADLPAVSCHHRCRREASERAAPRTWRGGSGSVPAAAARRSSHAPRLLRHVRGGLGRTPSPRHRRPCQLVRTLNIFLDTQGGSVEISRPHLRPDFFYPPSSFRFSLPPLPLPLPKTLANSPWRPPARQTASQAAACSAGTKRFGIPRVRWGFHVECTARCLAASAWPGHPGLVMFLCLPSLHLT